MATSVPKPPLSYGAMAMLGGMAPSPVDNSDLTTPLTQMLNTFMSPEEMDKDEMLAYAGGNRDPRGGGSFGGAMSAGFKAQGEARQKNKEMMGLYVPQILNTIMAQRSQAQADAMMQNMSGPQGGAWIQHISRQFGIAPEAIMSDVLTNGGKGIREMIAKNSTPDVVLQDGAWVDKNPYTNGMYAQAQAQGGNGPRLPGQAVAGGTGQPFSWLPGLSTSANGTSSLRLPDPSAPGGVRVQAPLGGVDTAGEYAEKAERVKGGYDPQTVRPQGQPPQMTTRTQLSDRLRGGQSANQMSGQPTGNVFMPQAPGATSGINPAPTEGGPTGNYMRGSDGLVDLNRAMRDINAMTNPAQKAEAWAALNQQIAAENARGGPGTQPNPPAVGGAPAGDLRAQLREAEARRDPVRIAQLRQQLAQQTQQPATVGMPLQSEAENKRESEAIETEQKNVASNLENMKKAQLSVQKYEEAIDLIKKAKPTSSGFGSIMDKAGDFVGVALPGRDAAEELKTIGGWLTANVPRMEGPQSNFDVENYQRMAGMVGNDRLPMSTRLKSAERAMKMIIDSAPKEFGEAWSVKSKETAGASQPSLSELARRELARRKGSKE